MRDFAQFLQPRESDDRETDTADHGELEVRLAIYDAPLAVPRVLSLRAREFREFVGRLAEQTYNHCRERGGRIPYGAIREIVENLIHAYFRGAVISILNDGNTIRISDQGPGIANKERALLPGFTTATPEMQSFIKGVGSGLPVAKEQLAFLGGELFIEDNLTHGTVVTLTLSPEASSPTLQAPFTLERAPRPDLTPRQKKILLIIAELGSGGPSAIGKELAISHSTAYRELQLLEQMQLVRSKGHGKRTLTEEGIAFLDAVFAR